MARLVQNSSVRTGILKLGESRCPATVRTLRIHDSVTGLAAQADSIEVFLKFRRRPSITISKRGWSGSLWFRGERFYIAGSSGFS